MQTKLTDFATVDEPTNANETPDEERETDAHVITDLDHDPECGVCGGSGVTTITTASGDERPSPCFAGVIFDNREAAQ